MKNSRHLSFGDLATEEKFCCWKHFKKLRGKLPRIVFLKTENSKAKVLRSNDPSLPEGKEVKMTQNKLVMPV